MKFTKTIFLLIPFLLLTSMNKAPEIKKYFYTNDYYGPFSGKEDITGLYFYNTLKGHVASVKIEAFYSSLGTRFGTYNGTAGNKSGAGSTVFNISIGTRINYGVRLDVYFDEVLSQQIELHAPSKEYVNVSRYKEESLTYSNIFFGIERDYLYSSETYTFSNLSEYISVDERNVFDLSEISFQYSYNFDFVYEKAYLQITDYERVYHHLISKTNNVVKVPLSCNKNLDKVSFEFASEMYVNKSTLQMSDVPLSGHEATNVFYLPIGNEEKMTNNEIGIVIEGAGKNLSTLYFPLQFYDYKRLLGFCYDSDYCIEGGVRK